MNLEKPVPVLIEILYKKVHRSRKKVGLFRCTYNGCTNTFITTTSKVKSGHTCSCGCYKKFTTSNLNRKHSSKGTRLYRIWSKMIQRCYSKSDRKYSIYGAIGVVVCDSWKRDFNSFKNWSILNGYSDSLTINRIKCAKIYSPETCEWVDNVIQSQDTRLLKSSNVSGYRGVGYCKIIRKWRSRINSNNVQYNLGSYDNPIDAAKAYNAWVIEHKTHHPLNPV